MSPALIPSLNASAHGAYVPLGYQSLTTTTAVIYFNNIPQIYQDLYLVVYGRSDIGGVLPSGLSLYTQQASGTANFSATGLYGNGSSYASNRFTTSSPTYGFQSTVAVFPSSGAPSNLYGMSEAHLLNYASTTTNKSCLIQSAGNVNGSGVSALTIGLWAQTSAITTLQVATYGNFVAGSSAALYGVRSVGQ